MKSIKEKYAGGEQWSRHAMQEFGSGKKEFIFCPHGEAVYFKKSWHHVEKLYKSYEVQPHKLHKGIKFKLCPAHEMQKNKQYEGEVVIKNIPAKFRRELVNLIENMGERAMRRDVLDRVLDIKITSNQLLVTTSENQLAQKISHKISETFNKRVDVRILRAKGADVVRVQINFA